MTSESQVRTTCVGRQLEHLETKLVDADGRVVPRGQVGELCLRGYAVMSGYWKESESTAQVYLFHCFSLTATCHLTI